MNQLYTAVAPPLMLLIGQTLVAFGQRRLNIRMDEGDIIDRKCYKHDAQPVTEAE